MIDVLLQNLERGFGQNAGSIPSLELLPCMHVDLWPGARNGMMLGLIKLKAFRDWTKLYLTDHTTGFSEKVINTSHGRKYSFQINGFYPGDSQELRQFIAITDAVKFIARIRDAHGMVRIVGNNCYGLEFDMDSMIAAEMGGKRGTSFTLSAELPDSSALAY